MTLSLPFLTESVSKHFICHCLQLHKYSLDVSRKWPPVHSCLFAQDMNLVCYHGNPATNSQAKDLAGLTLLANRPIPPSGLSFYYECHVCSLGAAKESDAAVALTVGLTPPPPTSKPSGNTSGFNLPQGACGARRSVLWGAVHLLGVGQCCGVLWGAVHLLGVGQCCGVLCTFLVWPLTGSKSKFKATMS